MADDAEPRLVVRQNLEDRSMVLVGELDVDTTALLREAIEYVAARSPEARRLVLDLSALTYCDEAGLFALVGICQALDAVGITVAIAWTGTVADTAIERAGLQDRLPLRSF